MTFAMHTPVRPSNLTVQRWKDGTCGDIGIDLTVCLFLPRHSLYSAAHWPCSLLCMICDLVKMTLACRYSTPGLVGQQDWHGIFWICGPSFGS